MLSEKKQKSSSSSRRSDICFGTVPKLAPPELPTGGGGPGAQIEGPVNSQYVVLFTQRMIKVP